MQEPEWMPRAQCRVEGHSTELFFFPVGTVHTQVAKQVCGRCPVRQECLSWALESGQTYGVFGGLDEHERDTLRRGTSQEARA